MTASTDGSAGGTTHSEVDSTGARVLRGHVRDPHPLRRPAERAGRSARQRVLFLITDSGDNSPTYSEMDFEYLPTGGWGDNRTQLDFTSWHSSTDSRESDETGSPDGWHTLVLTMGGGTATYYVDGQAVFSTSGAFYRGPRCTSRSTSDSSMASSARPARPARTLSRSTGRTSPAGACSPRPRCSPSSMPNGPPARPTPTAANARRSAPVKSRAAMSSSATTAPTARTWTSSSLT
jgi:hypothetical protein